MKKNFIYSLLYEIIIAFYPILMLPYISHVLGKNGVGIYSYTYAVLGFFLLGCQLGVNLCGTRAIAQARDDVRLMTRRFKSIFSIQFGFSFLVILIYVFFIETIFIEYRKYFYLLLPFLLGQAIRVSWFYLGLGEVKIIFARNILIRAVSAFAILIFVRTEDDLVLYFIIMSFSYLIGDVSVWPNVLKRLVKEAYCWEETKKYIFPMFKMFLPLLALKGAYYIDEIMLGAMHAVESVAIYENAYKIISMLLQFYTVISNVLTAQASNLVANKKVQKNIEYIVNTIDYSSALMIPLIVGLITMSSEFIPWFMGKQFLECIELMHFLPVVLILTGITSILRTQYFIPMGKDNKYISTIFVGVFLNILLNSILIPLFGYVGAAMGTIISELLITVMSVYIVSKEYKMIEAFRFFHLYIIGALLMGTIIRYIGSVMGMGIHTNIVQIGLGVLVYAVTVLGLQSLLYKKNDTTILYLIKQKFRKVNSR